MPCLQRFPFPIEFISEEILQRRREVEIKINEQNTNKFDWGTVIKYNMQVSKFFFYLSIVLGLSILVVYVRCNLEMQIQVKISNYAYVIIFLKNTINV
jgi:hypothetical protein